MSIMRRAASVAARLSLSSPFLSARADSLDPDLIFRKSTTFKFLTPNDKLAVYGIDDPAVEGVACHYTTPEKGGVAGALGLAERRPTFHSPAANTARSSSRRNSLRATSCSASGGRSSSRKCRSSGDAVRGGWSRARSRG
jgi:hypothetical protein